MFYKELLLLLLLLQLLLLVTFIRGIYKYSYIPETNHASRLYSVAATLWLQFILPVMLFPQLNISYFYLFSSFVVWILLIRMFFLFFAVPRVSRERRVHCSLAPLAKIRLCETGFARCTEFPFVASELPLQMLLEPFGTVVYYHYHYFYAISLHVQILPRVRL